MALVQLASGPDTAANLRAVERLVREAANRKVELVLLPEAFASRGPVDGMVPETVDGPSISMLRSLASDLGVAIHGGSTRLLDPSVGGDRTRPYNTSIVIDRAGSIVASYRKVHLFRIDMGPSLRDDEGAHTAPGDAVVVADLHGWRLGLSICYDLRFPELYRALMLQGAELMCVPSNFSAVTGRDHWEPLLRARAIENQAFVLAPAQCGTGGDGFTAYGHTMVVDPWGRVRAALGERPGVLVVDLDLDEIEEARSAMPIATSRRPEVYSDLIGPGTAVRQADVFRSTLPATRPK